CTFFSSRRRHTRFDCDWSSDVCSSDLSPQFRTNQNYTLSDSMSWTHGKHGWSWGGDFRHQLIDVSNASNARGTFTFNGSASGLRSEERRVGKEGRCAWFGGSYKESEK